MDFKFWNLSKVAGVFVSVFVYGKWTSKLKSSAVFLWFDCSVRNGVLNSWRGMQYWCIYLDADFRKALHGPEQQYWNHVLGIMKCVWTHVILSEGLRGDIFVLSLPCGLPSLPHPPLPLCSMWSSCGAQCFVFRNKMSSGLAARWGRTQQLPNQLSEILQPLCQLLVLQISPLGTPLTTEPASQAPASTHLLLPQTEQKTEAKFETQARVCRSNLCAAGRGQRAEVSQCQFLEASRRWFHSNVREKKSKEEREKKKKKKQPRI